MNGFNLLPEEFQSRRGARFVPISMLATLVVAVLIVALVERAAMPRTAGATGSGLDETLADRRQELARKQQALAAVEAEIAPLDAVLSQAPAWSNLFVDVEAVMGEGVWITRWSSDAKRGICSVQGCAEASAAAFAFMSALEKLPHFEAVVLTSVAKEIQEHDGGVRYEIISRLRHAAR